MFWRFLAGLVAMLGVGALVAFVLFRLATGDRREATPAELAQQAAEKAASGPRTLPRSTQPPPTDPLVLKPAASSWGRDLAWVIGLWFGALCLFGDPSLLWTRWLAWPAALVMLLLSIFPIVSGVANWRAGLTASASGLEWREGTGILKQLDWAQVRDVRLVQTWSLRATRQGMNAPKTRVADRLLLVFADAGGRPQIEIEAPLRPEADYQRLLDAVPAWAGVPVVLEDRDL